MQSPEDRAREKIDALLEQCGWILQNRSTINLSAGRGIAIREGLLKGGEADYLLCSVTGRRSEPSRQSRKVTRLSAWKNNQISMARACWTSIRNGRTRSHSPTNPPAPKHVSP